MPSGPLRQQTRQCSHCGKDFQYAVRRGRPNAFCSPLCRSAARSSSAEPPDLTRHDADLTLTTENLQHASTKLLAASQYHGDSASLMRQITDMRRLLDDAEAAVVARGRARGDSWKEIAQAAGCGAERLRKKWTQDTVTRRLTRVRQGGTGRPGELGGLVGLTERVDRGDDGDHSPTQTPAEQLAAALKCLHRSTGRPIKETALKVGVSPSYVSRILAGTRRPAWSVVERFADACDGNLLALRDLWETAQRQPDLDREPAPEDPEVAADKFLTALRAHYLAAGRPDLWTIQRLASAGRKPTINEIALVLNGLQIPSWETTAKIVFALGGRPAELRPLWQAAVSPPLSHSNLPASAFG
ncbi:helix-turn-helix domain-containing protein [Streptomyces sp. NPDC101115]|uniref:helix-turn-helix domain-containing protein n=1 Tax=Streptomyces sp. NPDC101115 TaxID=3366106 RepID=UPI003810D415